MVISCIIHQGVLGFWGFGVLGQLYFHSTSKQTFCQVMKQLQCEKKKQFIKLPPRQELPYVLLTVRVACFGELWFNYRETPRLYLYAMYFYITFVYMLCGWHYIFLHCFMFQDCAYLLCFVFLFGSLSC